MLLHVLSVKAKEANSVERSLRWVLNLGQQHFLTQLCKSGLCVEQAGRCFEIPTLWNIKFEFLKAYIVLNSCCFGKLLPLLIS